MTRASVGDALYQAGDDVLVSSVDPEGVVDIGEVSAVGRGVGGDDTGDLAGGEVDDDGSGGEGAVEEDVVAGEDAVRRHRSGWQMSLATCSTAAATEIPSLSPVHIWKSSSTPGVCLIDRIWTAGLCLR